MRKRRHREVKAIYPRSPSKWQSWGKFCESSPLSPLYFPAWCFLAIEEAVFWLVTRWGPTPHLTLHSLSPTRWYLWKTHHWVFQKPTHRHIGPQAVGYKAHDRTTEYEVWSEETWTTVADSSSSPSTPTLTILLQSTLLPLLSEASSIHSVSSHLWTQARKQGVISDHCPPTFP